MPSPEQAPLLDRPDRKLLLVGRGLTISQTVGREALALTGLERPKRILVNMAPADTPERYEKYLAKAKLAFQIDAEVEALSGFQEDPTPEELADKFGKADVVWTIGGSSQDNMAFMKRTGLGALLRDSPDKVNAGGSAGMTQNAVESMSWYTPDGHPENNAFVSVEGLGFVNAVTSPHLDYIERDDGLVLPRSHYFKPFLEDMAHNRVLPGLGVDDGAAIAFNGEGGHRILVQDDAVKEDGTTNPIGVTLFNRTPGNASATHFTPTADYIPVGHLTPAA